MLLPQVVWPSRQVAPFKDPPLPHWSQVGSSRVRGCGSEAGRLTQGRLPTSRIPQKTPSLNSGNSSFLPTGLSDKDSRNQLGLRLNLQGFFFCPLLADGKRGRTQRIAPGLLTGLCSEVKWSVVLPTSYWTQLSHMVTPNCKRCWEMRWSGTSQRRRQRRWANTQLSLPEWAAALGWQQRPGEHCI